MPCYADVLKRIFSLKNGTESARTLLTIEKASLIFNHPERAFKTIHVAGTNGKGSVCTRIASALELSGYKTGLYTSPHIACYPERMQINGCMITEEQIVAIVVEIERALEKEALLLTFFEMTTLIAFLFFQRHDVDVAVIETGIGGRFDATNIITPLLSVITSIGLDHTEILGNSIEEIAREKAGIIKRGVPVIIGPDVPLDVIEPIASELNSPLYQNRLRTQDYDYENQETARLALSHLSSHFHIENEAIEKGLKAKPPCRFQKISTEKKIILDVAHNPHGFIRLCEKLRQEYPTRRFRFLLGFSKSKAIEPSAKLIEKYAEAIYLVSSDHPRLASVEEIQKAFSAKNLYLGKSIAETVQKALVETLSADEILVITGSFFIMKDVREVLGISEAIDPHPRNFDTSIRKFALHNQRDRSSSHSKAQ